MANQVYKCNLKGYAPVLWNGEPIYINYSRVKHYLKQNLGEEYANLLTEPHINNNTLFGNGDASWLSDNLDDSNIKLISNLDASEQEVIREKLTSKIEDVQKFINRLSRSTNLEERKWAEIIEKCFETPDNNYIISDGQNVAIVLWGFGYESINKGAINSGNSFLKREERTQTQTPYSEIPKSENTPFNQPKKEDSFEPKIQTNEYNSPRYNDSNTTDNIKKSSVDAQNKSNADSNNNDRGNKNPSDDAKTKFNWKKYLWIPTLLFFVLISSYLFTKCQSLPNTKSTYLPDNPNKIIPIDTNKIVKDSSGLRKIIGDRLNIALVGKNKNISKFADAFKENFPSKNYKIIYYDTLTYRIQIEVPMEERDKLKKEIKAKMKDFEMLIFNEVILEKQKMPSDPDFGSDIKKYWYHKKVKATEAWDLTQGDTSIVIAIIDGGFDISHPEIANKLYKPMNVVKRSRDFSGTHSGVKHGTHVAGIALASIDNANGVSGIAPNCKLMAVQVADDNGRMSSTAIIDGILYAIHNGANVINLSLGTTFPNDIEKLSVSTQKWIAQNTYKEDEEFYNQLFEVAYKKNIIIVVSAGNQNIIVGLDPMKRSKYTINVSATDPDDKRATFSNYGDLSTISAPGVRIYNSIPGNKYDYLDGTSMAAPVVAGGVALIKSLNPSLSFDQVVDLIQSTGLTTNTTPEKQMGNILQLDNALGIAKKKRDKEKKVDCPDAQKQIDSLQQAIDRIKRECAEPKNAKKDCKDCKKDTLKIPKKGKSLDFSVGRWKSTTYLFSTEREKITIYFDFFANGKGKITLVEADGNECYAELSTSVDDGVFDIDQVMEAICQSKGEKYRPYKFQCKADSEGYAQCAAQNKADKSNKLEFKLIKIR